MNVYQRIFYSLPLIGAISGGVYSALTRDPDREQYIDEIILTSLFSAIALPTFPMWVPAYFFYRFSSSEDSED